MPATRKRKGKGEPPIPEQMSWGAGISPPDGGGLDVAQYPPVAMTDGKLRGQE